jgi:hypothetical protein
VACSPPVDPSIAALGPGHVVLLGTTGDPVAGGRAFHVEHYWNATGVATITIAFKEGEPTGDCSYPMEAGRRLIIAPSVDDAGRLHADLATPQADPLSPEGMAYLAEANRLFGPGTAPVADAQDVPADAGIDWSIAGIAALGLAALAAIVLIGGSRRRRRTAEASIEQAALKAEADQHRTEAIYRHDRFDIGGS